MLHRRRRRPHLIFYLFSNISSVDMTHVVEAKALMMMMMIDTFRDENKWRNIAAIVYSRLTHPIVCRRRRVEQKHDE